jgi:hypothetical protein
MALLWHNGKKYGIRSKMALEIRCRLLDILACGAPFLAEGGDIRRSNDRQLCTYVESTKFTESSRVGLVGPEPVVD